MNTLSANLTLAEIVNLQPPLARSLEAYNLDYCCGGGTTLQDACAAGGLDVAEVLHALSDVETTESSVDWPSMDLVQLVDHLEATHHRYLWSELPRLTTLMEKVVSVHGERHPELSDINDIFVSIRSDLEPHLMKEERVLFPMVRELAEADSARSFHCGSIQNPISVMLTEHDAVGGLLRGLQSLSDGYTPPHDACGSYIALFAGLEALEADTHLHIHKENNVLFPAVVAAEQRLNS